MARQVGYIFSVTVNSAYTIYTRIANRTRPQSAVTIFNNFPEKP